MVEQDAQYRLIALVICRVLEPYSAAVIAGARRHDSDRFGDHAKSVTRPDRTQPAQFITAAAAHAAVMDDARIPQQPERQCKRLETTSDQAAVRPLGGSHGIDMERLRVVHQGEVD